MGEANIQFPAFQTISNIEFKFKGNMKKDLRRWLSHPSLLICFIIFGLGCNDELHHLLVDVIHGDVELDAPTP